VNKSFPDIFSLKNKVAIVTGALGLIGRNHCYALSEAGANVIACDMDEMKCSDLANELSTESCGFYLDVTDVQFISRLRDFIVQRFGKIDILVNNAAINDVFENHAAAAEQSKFENYPLELWNKSFNVNVTGVFLCSQILGNVMAQKGKGSIINVASTYGVVAPDQSIYKKPDGSQSFFKSPVYSTTKGAVLSFTRFLAAYWGKNGVRVNSLSPGGVENGQDEYFINNYSNRTPLGKMAESSDYKGAVVFLASDASGYMTGANLIVDGGWTAW
jgi:NAD(P)-dependent dehydrogenase (short-subunit alcohol dehydrogenase family)